MRAHREWLGTMRGRILVWYIAALGTMLLAYCLFQTVTLSGYFRSANALSMVRAANAELATVGPCFIRSPGDLRRSAAPLAQLLGYQDAASTIVTPQGQVLAGHASGATLSAQPSAALIRELIPILPPKALHSGPKPYPAGATGAPTAVGRGDPRGSPRTTSCHPVRQTQAVLSSPVVRSGDIVRVAIPLGPAGHPVGYAVLARSVVTEDAELMRVRHLLWAGALVVLLITTIVALPIINGALRPLGRVTATAEAIAAGELEKRANLSRSVDEVGRLGRAFDAMVDRLQDALAGATASEERMRQFLADASHELRTPITVLRGTSEILLRQPDLEQTEVDAALVAMNQEANRISRLVDDLLRLSKLDAGQELYPHPIAVSPFLEAFVQRYAPAWPERSLELDRPSFNGAWVQVDPEALTRVLTNLVDNAARYSAPGAPIRIRGAAAERTVSIAVQDEGPGLSPEDARRAFERFYRGNKSRSRQSGGSGLGLAIVHALVRQSQGEVHLDTGPDRGTTVAITLPQPHSA